MSTTVETPKRVTITRIDREGFDFGEIRDGQGLQIGAGGLYGEAFEATRDPETSVSDAEFFFEQEVVDPAIEEVLPQIRDLVVAAIERRLPWTWEPER